MLCETLQRLSIEEVNLTSVRKTNMALSVLKAKQLQWAPISYGEKKLGGGYGWPPSRMGKILVGVGTVNWGPNPPTPDNSHSEYAYL